jgi:hypothetical protein
MKRVRKPSTEEQKNANRIAASLRYYRLTPTEREERRKRQQVYRARYIERHPNYSKSRYASIKADPHRYRNLLEYNRLSKQGLYPPDYGVFYTPIFRSLPTVEETILW